MKPLPVILMYPVRQASCGFLAAALALPAHAAWREIERFEDGVRIYVDDAAAVQRDDNQAILRHLVRWNEPQNDEASDAEIREGVALPVYLSTLVQTQYDCRSRLFKYLSSWSFAGAMGDGVQVTADEDAAGRWEPVSDGSMEEKLWKIACAIR